MAAKAGDEPGPRKRRPVVRAAGLVVFRTGAAGPEVLLVHRPGLRDWVLPKGHVEAGELAPETACREFHEETGHQAVVRAPVAVIDYPVDQAIKRVWWFLGELSSPKAGPVHNPAEIDQVAWYGIDQALATMTYGDERAVLLKARQLPPLCPLLVVRHGKALGRQGWRKDDWLRPLAARGRRQAKQLAHLLAAYGVGELASSPSTRCLETLQPFAGKQHLAITEVAALSEEAAAANPAGVGQAMRALRAQVVKTGRPLAVCGHRPVLPAMVKVLKLAKAGAEYTTMKPAEVLVAYLDPATGWPQAVERYHSKL